MSNFLEKHFAAHERKHQEFLSEYGTDYERSCAFVFGLNKAEQGAVNKWTASLRAEIMAIQKSRSTNTDFDDIIANEPYYGATGGGLSYSFTPTSLGTICVVTEAITGKSLNVAEATDWFFYG